MNPGKRFFFWLSGAASDVLEQCPEWEQRKYVSFGASVLVPCAFAFLASAYAISTLTSQTMVIYAVATVWAFIILTIDRALLASYRPFMSFGRKVGQFVLRCGVAVLMGLTIAHPLVLLLFRDTLEAVIERDRRVEVEHLQQGFTQRRERLRTQGQELENAVAAQRQQWEATYQATFLVKDDDAGGADAKGMTAEQQTELKKAVTAATAGYATRLREIVQQGETLTPQYQKLQAELGFWQSEFERELNGQRSGLAGEGPRARSVRADQLEPRREESRRLAGLLEHLATEKKALESQIRTTEAATMQAFEQQLAEQSLAQQAESERVADLKRKVQQDQAAAFVTQQNALRETIKQQIDTRLQELATVQRALVALADEEAAAVKRLLDEPRRDVLTQTLALHRLFESGKEGGDFARMTYLVLTCLFMLVDTIPLMVKFFTKAGPYDRLVDQEEQSYESKHRKFLQKNLRYLNQPSRASATLITQDRRLDGALLRGVEHTQASAEFLQSVLELERQFAEALREEEKLRSGPDAFQIQAVESVKQRYYAELQRRIEQFFREKHASVAGSAGDASATRDHS